MIRPDEIKRIIHDTSLFEENIDEMLIEHFKSRPNIPMKYNLSYNVSDVLVGRLVKMYNEAGWVVTHSKGCEDRPCSEPYNTRTFTMPYDPSMDDIPPPRPGTAPVPDGAIYHTQGPIYGK